MFHRVGFFLAASQLTACTSHGGNQERGKAPIEENKELAALPTNPPKNEE